MQNSNFIYFTTITKQVIQLILIMFVGTDVWVCVVFVWEETRILRGSPPARLGDQMTISHATSGIKQYANNSDIFIKLLQWRELYWKIRDCVLFCFQGGLQGDIVQQISKLRDFSRLLLDNCFKFLFESIVDIMRICQIMVWCKHLVVRLCVVVYWFLFLLRVQNQITVKLQHLSKGLFLKFVVCENKKICQEYLKCKGFQEIKKIWKILFIVRPWKVWNDIIMHPNCVFHVLVWFECKLWVLQSPKELAVC